jgi:non-specific serine/threonine protein kinase
MLWQADAPGGEEVYLMLPRHQPADAAALAAWEREARHVARLQHPQLVPVLEIGVEERWPFIVSARAAGVTLAEQLGAGEPPAPLQSAHWLCDLLQGLAFVHEAGLAHGDVSPFSVLVDAQGRTLLLAGARGEATGAVGAAPAQAGDTVALQVQRAAGERDLLACGLLLHRLLAGRPALDEPDPPTAVQRLEREIVRLGWTTPQPVRRRCARSSTAPPSASRGAATSPRAACSARCRAGSTRRPRAAAARCRCCSTAMHSVGHLPARPGLMTRVSMLAAMEQQRLDAMIDVILQDPALAFELLRQVNGAQFAAHASRGAQGEGGVSTVRRAVQLIGVQGLRRAASGLRTWPGAASDAAAAPLAAALREAQLAAHVARTLCPADMDGEAAYIVALLQQLGRLLLRYHFADEADQIERLVDPDAPGQRGMPPTRPRPR